MDIQTLSNVINNFLRDVNKDLRIQKLTVTQEKLYVEYEPQEIEITGKTVVTPKKIDEDSLRKRTLKITRAKVKDPRIKAILEVNHNDTFESWLRREYPNVNFNSAKSALRHHPDLPVRKCIELLRARS